MVFLRGGARDPILRLYEFTIADSSLREILTPEKLLQGGEEKLSPEEKSRRERERQSLRGFTSFELSKDGSKILVSEDGEKYGFFDIGKGIKPGETMTLVWDKSTNSGSCHQWFKAVWESGEEGKPVKFDFCEKDLELEF